MSHTRIAACSCGQLEARVQGDPIRVSLCHCLACQRRTGSVFGAQARFASGAVTVSGESRIYTRRGEEGGVMDFRFCPQCGATVWYQPQGGADFIAIPVGAFADPNFPAPAISVWEERKHAWVVLPEPLEHIF